MLLRSQCEGIYVDALIRSTGVRLEGLNQREVRTLALRESVLSVQLQLGSDNGVLSPAMHVKRGLGHHEGAGIGHGGLESGSISAESIVGIAAPEVGSSIGEVHGTSLLEEAVGLNEGVAVGSNGLGATESHDGVGESINGVGVVEGLGSQHTEQQVVAGERRAVVNVLVRLHNPDEFLHGVIEVQLDFVARRSDRLVAGELKLGNQILMGVLGKTSTFISVQKHVVNIERGSNQRLVVSGGGLLRGGGGRGQVLHGPQALVNGADVKVNLDFVVLKSNQGESQTRVGAEPELERNVKGGLGEGIAGSAHLAGGRRIARAINVIEGVIRQEGQLSGVSNHVEISTLLLGGHRQLVPDVHPVTVLTVNSLTTDFHLNLGDKLLTGEIQPTGMLGLGLVNLGQGNLQISAVGQITVSADGALHTATKIGLTVKSLFNRFNSKVSVPSVSHLPESNLRIASKIHVLSAVSD